MNQNDNLEQLDDYLPIGMRLDATDTELVVFYLKKKITGEQLPANIIPTVNVYACNPEQLPLSLFTHGNDNEWFFFSNRRKGKILTEGGYYDFSYPPREAVYEKTGPPHGKIQKTGKLVGFKRILDFYYGKPPAGTKSKWTVQEFRVNPSIVEVKKDDHATIEKVSNLVLCKVIYNEPLPESIETVIIWESEEDKESEEVEESEEDEE